MKNPQELLDWTRGDFARNYGGEVVMTDNELDEIITQYGCRVDGQREMYERGKRNAESIQSATLSYSGY